MFRSIAIAALCVQAVASAAGPSAPVVNLWPDLNPGGGPEVWVERGKGVVDRAVSDIHQPSLTVYLPDADVATDPRRVSGDGGVVVDPGVYSELVQRSGDPAQFVNVGQLHLDERHFSGVTPRREIGVAGDGDDTDARCLGRRW